MELFFSEQFDVSPATLDSYGAFDISVVSDLPLFVDPFLLFNSDKPEYRKLHEDILRYLVFLRDRAAGDLDPGLINSWFRFKEVKQNWFGYTHFGNEGAGLGPGFARSLLGALQDIFRDFGNETVTQSSHLEKLCLIRPGIGKDNISDFTTNLIKGYLLEYTEAFAISELKEEDCRDFAVVRSHFSYETDTWVTRRYFLPRLGSDFVLLTPADILTREDTWISHSDMITKFAYLPAALPNDELRSQVNAYFKRQLGKRPNKTDRDEAAHRTIAQFPALIDFYIRLKEDQGDRAESISAERVDDTRRVLVDQIRLVVEELEEDGAFYEKPTGTYEECLERAKWFKSYVEDRDGYRLINRAGLPFSRESEVQLFFGLIWFRTEFDVNREVNNGRGPVDFKVSSGSFDATLIEFKLGSNTGLERNLLKQLKIYEAANRTRSSVKVIVYYTAKDESRTKRILKNLELEDEESIVLIDARADNKPSASKA